MEAETYLKKYIEETSPFLKEIFRKYQKGAVKISPLAAEMMEIYLNFMGGKNIRGALIKLGYECFGGKNKKAILQVSLMAEIIHAFLLMHDDIMDQDSLRRGRPTIHVQYESLHRQRYSKGNPEHYGLSMAINLGDAGFAISHLMLEDADFSGEIKERVLRRFDEQILTTAYGQAIDVSYEHYQKVTEEDVMRVHHYKTANYTITGPLQYGALFAGAGEKEIAKIERFGLPVGIAFQIRDDELGIFSDEKKLGKPIGSDIRENKNTLLHLKSLEWASKKERTFLADVYGKKDLTNEEVQKVQKITVRTGTLAYSQKLAKELVEKGKKFVPQITDNPELQDTLNKMADFMIERTS